MLPGCLDLRASTARFDMRVTLAPRTPVVCVTSSDYEVLVYSAAYDMRVLDCVDNDPTWYSGEPIGEPVLGDIRLG